MNICFGVDDKALVESAHWLPVVEVRGVLVYRAQSVGLAGIDCSILLALNTARM